MRSSVRNISTNVILKLNLRSVKTNLLVPSLWASHVQRHAPSPPAPCESHGHAPPQGHPGWAACSKGEF